MHAKAHTHGSNPIMNGRPGQTVGLASPQCHAVPPVHRLPTLVACEAEGSLLRAGPMMIAAESSCTEKIVFF